MERQIIIKEIFNDKNFMVNYIVDYLLQIKKNNIIFNFTIFDEKVVLQELNKLKNSKIVINKIKDKAIQVEVLASDDEIKYLINLLKNYEINAVIICEKIKLFINDNDGDFIIIDTKNSNYKQLKNYLRKMQINKTL